MKPKKGVHTLFEERRLRPVKDPLLICRHCGNVVAMIRDCGVAVQCCGESMKEWEETENVGAEEKHRPLYTVNRGIVTVTVGQEGHPMLPNHCIEWIGMKTKNGFQYTWLPAGALPQATFALAENDEVEAVYAFCNQHSLWKQEKQ